MFATEMSGRAPWRVVLLSVALLSLAILAACGGGGSSDDGGPDGATPDEGVTQSFGEGDITVDINTLDTGLIKGSASARAAEGWHVTDIVVAASDPEGHDWNVLQLPQDAIDRGRTMVFEVVLQELARGEQIDVTAVAIFEDEDGNRVERRLTDTWPP
jgi:hypothetical protein